jgi:universal stress protein F
MEQDQTTQSGHYDTDRVQLSLASGPNLARQDKIQTYWRLIIIQAWQNRGEITLHKSILIPVDLANVTVVDSLLDYASALGGSNSKIILLNVVEEIPDWAAVELPRGTLDKSVQSSLEKLKALAASASIEVEVEVRVGHPYKTILEVAQEKRAEMIIVSSHQPELQNFFLGSTAAKVVRHATCSVLVVR